MKYALHRSVMRKVADPSWGPTIDEVFKRLESDEGVVATNALTVVNHALHHSIFAQLPIQGGKDLLVNLYMSGMVIGAALAQDGEFSGECKKKFDAEDAAGFSKVLAFEELKAIHARRPKPQKDTSGL